MSSPGQGIGAFGKGMLTKLQPLCTAASGLKVATFLAFAQHCWKLWVHKPRFILVHGELEP